MDSTGPGLAAAGAGAADRAPRRPRPAAVAGAPSPAYGDWTKPSGSSGSGELDLSADDSGRLGLRVPIAPPTTAIPERPVNRRDRSAVDRDVVDVVDAGRAGLGGDDSRWDGDRWDRDRSDSGRFGALHSTSSDARPAHGPSHGPGTGPVGNRAAQRAERQAADMARRKAAKRSGEPVGLPADEDGPGHRPRRILMGVLATVVVALGVLGGYTVVGPDEAQEAAAETTATAGSAPTLPTETAVLPPLNTDELEIEVAAPPPPTPVLAPVTVLNATGINGLAAQVSASIAGGGWETPGVGTYLADDIATSTVFYTEGNESQRLAAESLRTQFPQLQTTAVRFFEVPADVAAPGLVVVVTADWQP